MSKRKKKKYADSEENQATSLKQGEEADAESETPAPAAEGLIEQPKGRNQTGQEGEQRPAAKKRQLFGKKEEEPGVETYKRALWKHLLRYVILSTIVLLNISTVMSFLTRLPDKQMMNPWQEIFFFLTVAIVNLLFAVPAIFEVNRARLAPEGLQLNTLLWRTRLKWSDLVEFEQPRFLKFAILRTKRCFYLINRRDIYSYESLARSIKDKMASTKK
jgi:hypothetical protein